MGGKVREVMIHVDFFVIINVFVFVPISGGPEEG